jgi:hypothetical protein
MCICEYNLVLENVNFVSNSVANIVRKSWNYCVTKVILDPAELITCLEQMNFLRESSGRKETFVGVLL